MGASMLACATKRVARENKLKQGQEVGNDKEATVDATL
jgi:hypothetical protein